MHQLFPHALSEEGWTGAALGAAFPAAERWVEKSCLNFFPCFGAGW